MQRLNEYLPRLWTNWITLLGAVLTTMSGVALVVFLAMEFLAAGANLYTSSFLFVILPTLFVAGLVLIPIGHWRDRVHRRKNQATLAAGGVVPEDPVEAAIRTVIRDQKVRSRILFVALATLVNILIFSLAGQKAVSYMDSPKFCGTTCHEVMQPEWEGYQRSPHSRVACVQCHIGPGATWALKAKLNGLHQVWSVLSGTVQRPVPSPVEQLRPSPDTCEQCHWPQKFTGNRMKVFPHYKADKDNTPAFNVQLLLIGGQNPKTKKYQGIHWHVAANEQVRFEYRNRERTQIGEITVLENGAVKRVYKAPGPPVQALGTRTMDCVDCHNRPTHVYDLGPKEAVDRAIWEGRLDRKVPYLVEVARDLLTRKEVPGEGTLAWFTKTLGETYAKRDAQPTSAQLSETAAALTAIWQSNIFPKMNVGWRTYRSHLGHEGEEKEILGCFRCHDKEHEATLPDGSKQALSQSCDMCHESLATEEDPAKFDDTLQAIVPAE